MKLKTNLDLMKKIEETLGHSNFILVHQLEGKYAQIDTSQGILNTIAILKDCIISLEAINIVNN